MARGMIKVLFFYYYDTKSNVLLFQNLTINRKSFQMYKNFFLPKKNLDPQ